MANMTATEQLMLELVNRARMNPVGEAKLMKIDLNKGLAAGTISSAPKQVLAGNDTLNLSADTHSTWMLDTDTFSHTGSGGSTPTQRMVGAGYSFGGGWTNGENIALVGVKKALDLTKSIFEQHKNLFLSTTGHRQNIMNDAFREVGIGQIAGDYKGYQTSMVTQNFAKSGDAVFVTGVVYNDTRVNDNFFTVGEETANMAVTGGRASDTTGTGGGYELALTSGGPTTVTFAGVLSVAITVGSSNLKVDLVNGTEIWTNATVTSLSTGITQLSALGVSDMDLTGTDASETITGNIAANVMTGNGGNDVLVGNGGLDTFIGGTGVDTMTGGAGNDRFVFLYEAESGLDAQRDVIIDFDKAKMGDDIIDLSALFPGGALTYMGKSAITGANQVNVTAQGADIIVHINLDDDLADEMQILLKANKITAMTATDFIL